MLYEFQTNHFNWSAPHAKSKTENYVFETLKENIYFTVCLQTLTFHARTKKRDFFLQITYYIVHSNSVEQGTQKKTLEDAVK